jgi:hypothetical protein
LATPAAAPVAYCQTLGGSYIKFNSYHTSYAVGGKATLGILIGIVIGVLIVLGAIWYLKGSEFAAATDNPKPQAAVPNTVPPTATNESRFTFYKTLPAAEASPPSNLEGTGGRMPVPATADKTSTYLQVGAFQLATDAESQRAKLALVGIDSAIQVADLPGKGKMFRVAVGPFTSAAEQTRVRTQLQQAGIPFFDMRKDN